MKSKSIIIAIIIGILTVIAVQSSVGQTNTVMNVVGLERDNAEALLIQTGFTIGDVTFEKNISVQTNTVLSQDPVGGTELPAGSAINLVIAVSGIVPDVVGVSGNYAIVFIERAGLVIGAYTCVADNTVPSGTVINQSPLAGTELALGSVVDLVIGVSGRVPDVVGMQQEDAEQAILDYYYNVGTISFRASPTVPEGIVISQDPVPNTVKPQFSRVNLVVSSGPMTEPVPNVVGMTQEEATTAIMIVGFIVGNVTTQTSATIPLGFVISQNPVGGTAIPFGDAIDLVVSLGVSATVFVPDVVGMTQDAATTTLEEACLVVGTITTYLSDIDPIDAVSWQSLSAGTEVASGSIIDLEVCIGTASVIVPDVVGMTPAEATTAITEADLVVGTVTEVRNDMDPVGTVIWQSLMAGSSRARGSVVDLEVCIGTASVVVPDVVGMTPEEATTAITEADLVVGTVTEVRNDIDPVGTVIWQSLMAGSSRARGSVVDLEVCIGPITIRVPNVVGLTQEAAVTAIVDAELVVGNVTTHESNSVPIGSVISQDPEEGNGVNVGSAVDLVVSCGIVTTISINDNTQSESIGNMNFTVTLSDVSALNVTVEYTTSDGTAAQPDDYIASSGTIIIPAGYLTGTINVPIIDDGITELDETFMINLSNPINTTVADGSGEGVIQDNDFSQPPIVDAGSDQWIITGETVQLDGSGSSDPDNDPLSYSWEIVTKPSGSTATLSDPAIVNPTFIADAAGAYVVQLIVNDGAENSDPDEVTITALTPAEATQDLIDDLGNLLEDGDLTSGNLNALMVKLEGILAKIDQDNINATMGKLNAFINQVNDFVLNGKISPEDGQYLIDWANSMIASLSSLGKEGHAGEITSLRFDFKLEQNYPNPFNPETSISYDIPEEVHVTVAIYNTMGVKVKTLYSGQQNAGYHTVKWDGKDESGRSVSGGIYICRIQAGTYNSSIKMMLLK